MLVEIEIWKGIDGYTSLYAVSNLGRVKAIATQKVLVGFRGQYSRVLFRRNGGNKKYSVHRLVAIAFLDNPHRHPQVNHINGNKFDNRAVNLEWCDSYHNMQHAHANGLMRLPRGLDHVKAKIVIDLNTGVFYYSILELNKYYSQVSYFTLNTWLHNIRLNRTQYRLC